MPVSPISANFRKHKSALTRAKKTGDPTKVLAACDAAILSFSEYGWPDDWAHFQRAADDVALGARCY